MPAFLPADPEIALYGVDLAFPFRLDGTGDLAVVEGEANLLSALPVRAVTGRGEVPIFPDDGLDFEDFQNGLITPEERALLEARLLEQYRRDDRIASLTVTAEDGSEDGETIVTLDAKTRSGRTLSVGVTFGNP